MASASGIIQVANETESSSSRITKEGKKITYRMRVIQQPERARACGSGAKCKHSSLCVLRRSTNHWTTASADRRPVDPPPIVELRIFEGPSAETDITFSYNANFFLFATLENARHLAQGRVPPPSQPAFPVLTGTPVAGMAYLDRPAPAGYFIFPDLSVRHEGKYRLSFSLYEELKEQKDMDSETPQHAEIQKSAHVSHRLEVKSIPFTVFSAKKFPGLTESTALSRMVAEQGCRVRIRRDVRMRRRENKSSRDFDDFDDDEYSRHRASATPDAYNQAASIGTPRAAADGADRPRSGSNASQYGAERRSSMEMAPGYQQQYSNPLTPQTPHSNYNAGQIPNHWQPPPPQMGYMQPPPPTTYSQQQSYPSQTGSNMSNQGYFMPPQFPSYDHSHQRHNSVEYPRPPSGPSHATATSQATVPQYPSSNNTAISYGSVSGSSYSQPQQMSPAPALQPIQTANGVPQSAAPYQSASASSPMPKVENTLSPTYPAHTAEASASHSSYYEVSPPKYSMQQQPNGATKRSYSATFDTEHMDQRLQQGARPSSSANDPAYAAYSLDGGVDEDGSFDTEPAMSYRRADGTERRRRVPILS